MNTDKIKSCPFCFGVMREIQPYGNNGTKFVVCDTLYCAGEGEAFEVGAFNKPRAYESEITKLTKRCDELKAARISYANLFDGDVGNIHENIRRALKKRNARQLFEKAARNQGYTVELEETGTYSDFHLDFIWEIIEEMESLPTEEPK